MSPLDVITTKRPFAVMSPANESRVELVTCETNGSGVKLAVLWAEEESAPATSIHAATAHRKA
jgi:hypothetical protein